MELSHHPEIQILGIYPKDLKPRSQRGIYMFTFITLSFTIANLWKKLKCPLTMNG